MHGDLLTGVRQSNNYLGFLSEVGQTTKQFWDEHFHKFLHILLKKISNGAWTWLR